ncbi:hypothetical protein DFH09DRAFT_1280417 [Mycena vulgaris]|nr:hypothetical protein DFH09DRAFT_1280417 [Mycena vulgaris]
MPSLPRLFLAASFVVAVFCDIVVGEDSAPARRLTPLMPYTRKPLKAQKSKTVIEGLLVARQSCNPGYGSCSNGGCCRIGGQCCNNGVCCLRSEGGCDDRGCCNLDEHCCTGGACCSAGSYCDVVDGKQGCCEIGKICTGTSNECDSAGFVPCANEDFCCRPGAICYRDSSGNPGCRAGGSPPPPPTTKDTTSTTHKPTTAKPTPTPGTTTTTADDSGTTHTTSAAQSTHSTGSAPTSVPTAPTGYQNVFLDLTSDINLRWTGDWVVVPATCSSGNKAKSCSGNSSTSSSGMLMYDFQATSIYLSVASINAQYTISIDSEETSYGLLSVSTAAPTNCTFGWSKTNLSVSVTHYLQITVNGPAANGRRDSTGDWALELQNLVITQPGSSTSRAASGVPSSASTASTQTGSASSSVPSNLTHFLVAFLSLSFLLFIYV